jgi:hypothetical protein
MGDAAMNATSNDGGVKRALIFAGICLLVMGIMPFVLLFGWVFIAPLVALILIGIAALLARPWRRALGSTELAIYWLALALSVGWSAGGAIYAIGSGPRTPLHLANIALARGAGTGAGIVAGSALVLAFLRRRALGGTEIAIYWLGSALAISVALLWLFEATGWKFVERGPDSSATSGILAGAALTAGSALLLALWRGRALGASELLIYLIGSAVAIGFVAGILWYATLSAAMTGILVAGLMVLPLWFFLTRRKAN